MNAAITDIRTCVASPWMDEMFREPATFVQEEFIGKEYVYRYGERVEASESIFVKRVIRRSVI